MLIGQEKNTGAPYGSGFFYYCGWQNEDLHDHLKGFTCQSVSYIILLSWFSAANKTKQALTPRVHLKYFQVLAFYY